MLDRLRRTPELPDDRQLEAFCRDQEAERRRLEEQLAANARHVPEDRAAVKEARRRCAEATGALIDAERAVYRREAAAKPHPDRIDSDELHRVRYSPWSEARQELERLRRDRTHADRAYVEARLLQQSRPPLPDSFRTRITQCTAWIDWARRAGHAPDWWRP